MLLTQALEEGNKYARRKSWGERRYLFYHPNQEGHFCFVDTDLNGKGVDANMETSLPMVDATADDWVPLEPELCAKEWAKKASELIVCCPHCGHGKIMSSVGDECKKCHKIMR